MSELVADCPRCGAIQITFDLTSAIRTHTEHGWQQWYEAFCICRACDASTVFVLSKNMSVSSKSYTGQDLVKYSRAANQIMNVEWYICIKDFAAEKPPEHLPDNIEAVFREGAACAAIGCFNAAATMFRLCLDLSTKPMLPAEDAPGLNRHVRRSLGLRLPWLFDNDKLPEALRDLSSCIKDDGDDGAHAGTLSKEDAADILDFTTTLLERIYTEPEKLKIAKKRKQDRRRKPGGE